MMREWRSCRSLGGWEWWRWQRSFAAVFDVEVGSISAAMEGIDHLARVFGADSAHVAAAIGFVMNLPEHSRRIIRITLDEMLRHGERVFVGDGARALVALLDEIDAGSNDGPGRVTPASVRTVGRSFPS